MSAGAPRLKSLEKVDNSHGKSAGITSMGGRVVVLSVGGGRPEKAPNRKEKKGLGKLRR